ncbi:MAG TPA: alpha/beta hydrolase [Paracoccaceae bacterium]|mgnify:CR=1 FL=1|nr:alpha/beta hydrolase [Paracoccaceae bacterium]
MAKDTNGGVGIHTQTFGAGDRRGLALHCSLAHAGAWKTMAGALEEPLALTVFDLPGHGKSADWDGTGDYTALCADIAAALIEEDEGQVDLIGHSGGAVAALQLALDMPERVRTLTLIEPVLFAAARGTAAWDQHMRAMAPYMAALEAGDRALAAESFTAVWGTGRPWADLDETARQYLADRIHLIEAGMPALAEDNAGVLAEGRLETLDLPVMIVIGTESPPVIAEIAEAIAARLPDVGLAEVPGAGHLLTVTHASQLAGLVDVNLGRD